jgi:hypothetical protein
VEQKEIHIFDLDDTLLHTPTISDFVKTEKDGVVDLNGKYGEVLQKLKNYFYIIFSKEVYFKKQGDYILLFDVKTNNPLSDDYISYIQDLSPESLTALGLKRGVQKDMLRMFGSQKGLLALESIPGFHSDADTIGKSVNQQIVKQYSMAKNKMILTGRGSELSEKIKERLESLGLDYPNYGLFTYPGGSTGIQNFKNQTILDTIAQNDWDIVNFYEDREDWLNSAKKIVQDTYPNVLFIAHHIKNIKDARSL